MTALRWHWRCWRRPQPPSAWPQPPVVHAKDLLGVPLTKDEYQLVTGRDADSDALADWGQTQTGNPAYGGVDRDFAAGNAVVLVVSSAGPESRRTLIDQAETFSTSVLPVSSRAVDTSFENLTEQYDEMVSEGMLGDFPALARAGVHIVSVGTDVAANRIEVVLSDRATPAIEAALRELSPGVSIRVGTAERAGSPLSRRSSIMGSTGLGRT